MLHLSKWWYCTHNVTFFIMSFLVGIRTCEKSLKELGADDCCTGFEGCGTYWGCWGCVCGCTVVAVTPPLCTLDRTGDVWLLGPTDCRVPSTGVISEPVVVVVVVVCPITLCCDIPKSDAVVATVSFFTPHLVISRSLIFYRILNVREHVQHIWTWSCQRIRKVTVGISHMYR